MGGSLSQAGPTHPRRKANSFNSRAPELAAWQAPSSPSVMPKRMRLRRAYLASTAASSIASLPSGLLIDHPEGREEALALSARHIGPGTELHGVDAATFDKLIECRPADAADAPAEFVQGFKVSVGEDVVRIQGFAPFAFARLSQLSANDQLTIANTGVSEPTETEDRMTPFKWSRMLFPG